MAWLLRRGEVLASLEVAHDVKARLRGYAGREDDRSVLLLQPARSAHSIGSHARLDVAYLDRELSVLKTRDLAPFRLAPPNRHSAAVLLAGCGAFERWGLRVGDQLEVRS
ncbi:MAG TPA: DUF192 domain-containing protein [Acidimicrobiales bacterium]|nr:DUF192 domain-containing protein [Acidimicrobiales bacterium]